MTIQEVEVRTGLPRATVRYYEREGLLSPQRLENGYRDYSEDNIVTLFRIKLLRELGISLEDIRALQQGKHALPEILAVRIRALGRERDAAAAALATCQAIQDAGTTYDTLDALHYLSRFSTVPAPLDVPKATACPWRRYFARMLDLSLYTALTYAVLAVVFHVNLTRLSRLTQLLLTYLELGVMLVLEPVFLHFFATTPGKAIFGIRVEYASGGHLSYFDAMARTLAVIGSGMGYNIPIYNLIRLYKSCKHQSEGQDMPWDWEGDFRFTIRENAWWRVAVYLAVDVVCIALAGAFAIAAGFPPHYGGLTKAEFADNYNAIASFYGSSGYLLDETGQWKEQNKNGYVVSFSPKPQVTMETDASGEVQSVTAVWSYRGDADHIVVWPQDEIQSFSMALAAGEGGWLSYWGRLKLAAALNRQWGSDGFTCREGGLTVSAQVDQSGYFDAGGEWYIFSGDADAQGAHCQITLTVSAT